MVQLSQEEIRQKMSEILKDQMERPTLRPQNRSEGAPAPKTAAEPTKNLHPEAERAAAARV
jgi:hypothetical protein